MMRRVFLLCMVCLVLSAAGNALAEESIAEWFDGAGEVFNSLGEHFCYQIRDDHAVLTQYWVEDLDQQPAVVRVPGVLGGYPLKAIGWCAFDAADLRDTGRRYHDPVVERIVVPEGVTVLENGAFLCANDVKQIELPATLSVISTEGMTFYNAGGEIVFPNGNPFFLSEDGFLMDRRTDALLYCSKSSASKPLPKVARVENNALMKYAPAQSTLEFPDSVTYIGGFNACNTTRRLKAVIIPASVREIGDFAFYGCYPAAFVLNEGLRKVGAFAFADTSTPEIRMPSTVEWLGYGAADAAGIYEGLNPACRLESEDEFSARYGIHSLPGAKVTDRSASPFRMLEIVDDGSTQYLRVTLLDGSGTVFATRALPPFTSLDTYHDGGVTILMDIPVGLPEEADWSEARNSPGTFDWDLVADAERYSLTFDYADGGWKLAGATNGQDWYFTVQDGLFTFEDYYEYNGEWQWQTTGEDRLTEIVFSDLVSMAAAYNEAMPGRFSLQDWDQMEEEAENEF